MDNDPLMGLPPVNAFSQRAAPGPEAAINEFEAYLIGEMLRRATKSESESTPLDGGHAGRMYRELFYEEIGRIAARNGGLGLGDSLADAFPGAPEVRHPGGEP
jgi:Rod binding domain-containing protein